MTIIDNVKLKLGDELKKDLDSSSKIKEELSKSGDQ